MKNLILASLLASSFMVVNTEQSSACVEGDIAVKVGKACAGIATAVVTKNAPYTIAAVHGADIVGTIFHHQYHARKGGGSGGKSSGGSFLKPGAKKKKITAER